MSVVKSVLAALGLAYDPGAVETPPGTTLYGPSELITGPVVRRVVPQQWNPSLTALVVLPSNPQRVAASLFNGSASNVFLGLSGIVSLTNYTVKLVPGSLYELPDPIYTGDVTVIWDALSAGTLLVSEQAD